MACPVCMRVAGSPCLPLPLPAASLPYCIKAHQGGRTLGPHAPPCPGACSLVVIVGNLLVLAYLLWAVAMELLHLIKRNHSHDVSPPPPWGPCLQGCAEAVQQSAVQRAAGARRRRGRGAGRALAHLACLCLCPQLGGPLSEQDVANWMASRGRLGKVGWQAG